MTTPAVPSYTAIVAGSTGATGRRLVEVLSRSPACQKVLALTRRPLETFPDDTTNRTKVEEVMIPDFESATLGIKPVVDEQTQTAPSPEGEGAIGSSGSPPSTPAADGSPDPASSPLLQALRRHGIAARADSDGGGPVVAFSALGTSPYSEKVDYDYSVNYISAVSQQCGPNLHAMGLVSSQGASADSMFGYMSLLGRREKFFFRLTDVRSRQHKTNIVVARPGPLDREELARSRLKERILGSLTWVVPHIHCRDVAKSMVERVERGLAENKVNPRVDVLEMGEMRAEATARQAAMQQAAASAGREEM